MVFRNAATPYGSGMDISRRRFIALGLAVPAAGVYLAGCGDDDDESDGAASATPTTPSSAAEPAGALTPTPSCDEGAAPTVEDTPGPFYLPGSPEKASFLGDGATGPTLVVSGTVLSTTCAPLAGVVLDFWHANQSGVYDNAGFRLRGRQTAGADGRFRLETVVPGLYPERTRHLHVTLFDPSGAELLITQLYFPGDEGNTGDLFFKQALLLGMPPLASGGERVEATFDFVLPA